MYERSYSELITFSSYSERLEYLKLLDNNAESPRHVSMGFYKSRAWLDLRDRIIKRDMTFDLGLFGMYIDGPIFVHHINPINEDDIHTISQRLMDPENLICTSLQTHNAIHYKPKNTDVYVERTPGDTILW